MNQLKDDPLPERCSSFCVIVLPQSLFHDPEPLQAPSSGHVCLCVRGGLWWCMSAQVGQQEQTLLVIQHLSFLFGNAAPFLLIPLRAKRILIFEGLEQLKGHFQTQ